jgi:hypothetical protein
MLQKGTDARFQSGSTILLFSKSRPMKAISRIILVFAALVFSATASAQAAKKSPSRAHLAAAERVVYAMGLPERFIIPTTQLLRPSLERDPDNAPLMATTMAPYLKKSYTAGQLKTYIAERFDLNTCRQIATFWEGPVGKKLVRNQVRMLTSGEAPQLVFTDSERELIKQFESTPASQEFVGAIPDIEDKLVEYTKNTQMRMREDFLDELGRRTRKQGELAS